MDSNDWTLTGNANIDPSTNFLGTTDDNPLVFKTRGIEAMRVAPVGNIGIGTDTPDFRLHIETGNQLNLAVKSPDESVGAGIQLQCQRGWELLATGDAAAQGASKFNLRDLATGRDVLTVSGEQNDTVGIGTTVPEATLHVASGNDFHTPQVEIEQTKTFDFARLRFVSFGTNPDLPKPVRYPLWDIAAGLGALNFFVQDVGNIMTLRTGKDPNETALTPRIGIGTERPETPLHVNGTATVGVLQITGGGDVAEPFLVENSAEVDPGTVMVIDENNPGKLRVSDSAYDRKVAGVVSGAGGMSAGLTLQHDHLSVEKMLVALAGCVYCKAEATSNPIEPGDLLTTSHIPGHAMKATNEQSLHGAIIGKAMSLLGEGMGLVLVLVNLH